ncbi:MAG: hypothetical protein RR619_10215 [Raoultibacter sp.]
MFEIYGNQSHFWQWDIDQKIILDGIPQDAEVHFSNAKTDGAFVVVPYALDEHTVADVPNVLLQQYTEILCYVKVSGKTVDAARYGVWHRHKPDDYIYTETEIKSFENLEQWVKDEISSIPQSATYLDNAEFSALTN